MPSEPALRVDPHTAASPDLPQVPPAPPGSDREAWARAWLPRVYGVALALTRRPADAEDLAQEALVKALREPEAHRSAATFGPWIVRVIRNAWIDRSRRAGRQRPLAAPDEVPARHTAGAGSVVAWGALPEDERLVCWLKISVGSTLREIAELLGTSKSAVDRTFRKGLDRLRKELSR